MKRKTKKMLKGLGVGLLVVGLVAGVATGAKTLIDKSNEEIKTINPRFSVGGLDVETGKYVEREDTLYTKTAFECFGLEISLTFDNDINYQLFFYEDNGDYLSSTEVLDSKFDDSIPLTATHARVMIIPQWSNLEATEDKTIDEQKVINWKNKSSFVKQMTIKVAKEQMNEKVTAEFIGTDEPEFIITAYARYTWKEFVEADNGENYGGLLIKNGYFLYHDFVVTLDGKAVKATDHIKNGTYSVTTTSVSQWIAENE